MTTAQAPEREFRLYRRGERREEILTSFRVHLRKLTNPDTGLPFTESEIATATAKHSIFWIRADAIDLVLLGSQNNAMWMADQVRVGRAGTSWLESYHGRMWQEERLSAEGGAGIVEQEAVAGTIFPGSTTLPDEAAYQCTAPDGKLFQLLYTTTAGGYPTSKATMTFKGVDTGDETNLVVGDELTPAANEPSGASGTPTVTENFSGGAPDETDAEYADRIGDRIADKPASGNRAHVRAWARQASASIEDAFVYPCALNAGSIVVCITQKRGTAVGPLARIPNSATLAAAIAYLTPPASPVLPARPFVLVVAPQEPDPGTFEASDGVLQLSMPVGVSSGWTDPEPWPGTNSSGAAATITTVTDQTHVKVTIPSGSIGLPTGVSAPGMMVWDEDSSRYEELQVQSVVLDAGLVYDVTLSAAPSKTLATGDYVCPDNGQREDIAEAVEAYFDSLGPGELVDSDDVLYHRAVRWPLASEAWPQRAGDGVITFLLDALGTSLADASLPAMSPSVPTLPDSIYDGPRMCILGKIGIYQL